jgi:hypothetical protein
MKKKSTFYLIYLSGDTQLKKKKKHFQFTALSVLKIWSLNARKCCIYILFVTIDIVYKNVDIKISAHEPTRFLNNFSFQMFSLPESLFFLWWTENSFQNTAHFSAIDLGVTLCYIAAIL